MGGRPTEGDRPPPADGVSVEAVDTLGKVKIKVFSLKQGAYVKREITVRLVILQEGCCYFSLL